MLRSEEIGREVAAKQDEPIEGYEKSLSALADLLVENRDLISQIENTVINDTRDPQPEPPQEVTPERPTVENQIQKAVGEMRKNNKRLNEISHKLMAALGQLRIYSQ